MADTQRSKTALLALYADNTSGDISPQDLRDGIVTMLGAYGDMRVEGGSAAQSGIGTSFTKMTGWNTNGKDGGVTPDQATGKDLTIGVDGDYLILFSISFTGTASTKFTFEVHKGGVAQGPTCEITLNATPDGVHLSCAGVITCSATDTIEIYVKADGAAKSITPTEATLVAKIVG